MPDNCPKALRVFLDVGILFCTILILIILAGGGFKIRVLGADVQCRGLSNPIGILVILLLLRFFLRIGFRNSLTLLGSLVTAAALVEILLRVINPSIAFPSLKTITEPSDLLGYRLVPGLRGNGIEINSHGLRDEEHTWEKPPGVKRLLGIGDSFTFGYQVEMKDCYLKQLEHRLNRSGVRWEVINAGVSGYNMWQYLAYFKSVGYRYRPDVVTLGVFFDDLRGDGSEERKEAAGRRYRSLSTLKLANLSRNVSGLLTYRYRHLLGASWLRSVEERREHILSSRDRLILTGEANPEVYQKFETRLKEFKDAAETCGAKVLVVMIPDVIQLNHLELQAVNAIIKQFCGKCEIEFLDITPVYEHTGSVGELYLLPYDAHTSPEGHRIIAEEMEKRINTMMRSDG